MLTDSKEPPLPLKSVRDRGYNKKITGDNKPASSGFSQFWAELAEETQKSEERIEKIIKFFSPVLKAIEPIWEKTIELFSTHRRLLWPLFLLLIMVLLPWISEASISSQSKAELKAFAQPLDPIKTGQLAMNLNQYLPPQLYADPDQVVLDEMTKKESYTLAQQLSVNAGAPSDGVPERQAPTYIVEQGETISQVATRFNLHVGTILDANNLSVEDLNKIRPGTELKIPSSDTDTSNDWLVALNKLEAERKARAEAEAAAASRRRTTSIARADDGGYVASASISRSSSYIKVIGTSYEQCVPWARANSGVQIRGYAGNIAATQSEPQVGGIALDRFFGHASVVVGISGDYIIVHEANYIRGKITERSVPRAAIRGYVY